MTDNEADGIISAGEETELEADSVVKKVGKVKKNGIFCDAYDDASEFQPVSATGRLFAFINDDKKVPKDPVLIEEKVNELYIYLYILFYAFCCNLLFIMFHYSMTCYS
jgi:hypothetical protein